MAGWSKVLQQNKVNASDLHADWSPGARLLAHSGDSLMWGDPDTTGGEISMSRIPYVNNEIYFPYIGHATSNLLQQEYIAGAPGRAGTIARILSYRGDSTILSNTTASFRADIDRYGVESADLAVDPFVIVVYKNKTGVDPNSIYVTISNVPGTNSEGRWETNTTHMSTDNALIASGGQLTQAEINAGYGTLRIYGGDSNSTATSTADVKDFSTGGWTGGDFTSATVRDVHDEDLVLTYLHFLPIEESDDNSFAFSVNPIIPYTVTTGELEISVNNFASNDAAVCLGVSVPGISAESGVGGGYLWDFNHLEGNAYSHGTYNGVFASENIGQGLSTISNGEVSVTSDLTTMDTSAWSATNGTYDNLKPTTDGDGNGFEAEIVISGSSPDPTITMTIICKGFRYAAGDTLTFSSGITGATSDLIFTIDGVDSVKYTCVNYVVRTYRNGSDVATRNTLNMQYKEGTNVNVLGGTATTTAHLGSATSSVRTGFYLVNNIPINLVGDVGIGTYVDWELFTNEKGGKLSAKLPQALAKETNLVEFNTIKLGADASTGSAINLYAGNKISLSGGGSPAGPYISRPSADIIHLDMGNTTGHVLKVTSGTGGAPTNWNNGTRGFVETGTNPGDGTFEGTVEVTNGIPDIDTMIITTSGTGYEEGSDNLLIKADDDQGTSWLLNVTSVSNRGKGALKLTSALEFAEPMAVSDGSNVGANSDVAYGIRLATETDISSNEYGSKFIQIKDTSTGDTWKNIEELSAAGPVTGHTAMTARKIVGNIEDIASIPQEVDIVTTISDNDDKIPSAGAVFDHYKSSNVAISGGSILGTIYQPILTREFTGFAYNEWTDSDNRTNPIAGAYTGALGYNPYPGDLHGGTFFIKAAGLPTSHFSPNNATKITGGSIHGTSIGGRAYSWASIVFDTSESSVYNPFVVADKLTIVDENNLSRSYIAGTATTGIIDGSGNIIVNTKTTAVLQIIELANAINGPTFRPDGASVATLNVDTDGVWGDINYIHYDVAGTGGSGSGIEARISTDAEADAVEVYISDNGTDYVADDVITFEDPGSTSSTVEITLEAYGHNGTLTATYSSTYNPTVNIISTVLGQTNLSLVEDVDDDDRFKIQDFEGGDSGTTNIGSNDSGAELRIYGTKTGINLTDDSATNVNIGDIIVTDANINGKLTAGNADIGSIDAGNPCRIYGTKTGINLTSDDPTDVISSQFKAGNYDCTTAFTLRQYANLSFTSLADEDNLVRISCPTVLGGRHIGIPDYDTTDISTAMPASPEKYFALTADIDGKIDVADIAATGIGTGSFLRGDGTWQVVGGSGTVTGVTTSTGDQLTVSQATPAPELAIVTGAVVDTGTALATGNQIYDFVTGLNYSTTTGTMTDVSDDASPTLGGDLDAADNHIGFTLNTVGDNPMGGFVIDWSDGNKVKIVLDMAGHSVQFTDPPTASNLVLMIVQGPSGGDTVTTWDSDILWAGGDKPELSTAADAIDIVSFFWDGTNYYGVASYDFKTE